MKKTVAKSEMTNLIGYCAVDSGQIMIADPSYLGLWDENAKFGDPVEKGHFSYPGACNLTLGENQAGQMNFPLGHAGAGVVASSGYGDGFYPVYATYISEWADEACTDLIDRRVAKLEIYFIDADEDERTYCEECNKNFDENEFDTRYEDRPVCFGCSTKDDEEQN